MPGMIPPLPPPPLRVSGRRHFPPVPPSKQWEDDWNGKGKRTFDPEKINPDYNSGTAMRVVGLVLGMGGIVICFIPKLVG